jgi:hypothetical protein
MHYGDAVIIILGVIFIVAGILSMGLFFTAERLLRCALRIASLSISISSRRSTSGPAACWTACPFCRKVR